MRSTLLRRIPIVTGVAASAGFTAGAAANPVAFVFDQNRDTLLRLADLNGDGDALDPGEATDFYNDTPPDETDLRNSLGLVALDEWTVVATDNFAPANVLLLTDLNRDGDALDPGEASVWWDGVPPSGLGITLPMELRALPDGSFLLLDNNTVDTTRPEMVFRLHDANADGDVNDEGEVTEVFELSPVGESLTATFDVIPDNSGLLYTFDIRDPSGNGIESIDIIDTQAGTYTEWFDSAQLYAGTELLLEGVGMTELEHIPETDEIVFGARELNGNVWIVAARQPERPGTIFVRDLWREVDAPELDGVNSVRDPFFATDGSLFFLDSGRDRVLRLIDDNGDGDFRDPGETNLFYDSALAQAAGLPALIQPLTLTVAAVEDDCPADRDGDSHVNVADLLDYLADFRAGAGDMDGDDDTDVQDLLAYLSAFRAGC